MSRPSLCKSRGPHGDLGAFGRLCSHAAAARSLPLLLGLPTSKPSPPRLLTRRRRRPTVPPLSLLVRVTTHGAENIDPTELMRPRRPTAPSSDRYGSGSWPAAADRRPGPRGAEDQDSASAGDGATGDRQRRPLRGIHYAGRLAYDLADRGDPRHDGYRPCCCDVAIDAHRAPMPSAATISMKCLLVDGLGYAVDTAMDDELVVYFVSRCRPHGVGRGVSYIGRAGAPGWRARLTPGGRPRDAMNPSDVLNGA